MTTLRVCFVTNRPAWPLFPGFKRRAGMVLEALTQHGDVHVLMALPDSYPSVPVPPSIDPTHVTLLDAPRPAKAAAVLRWVRGQLPMSMNTVDWGARGSEIEQLLAAGHYDVVWVLAGTAWPLVRSFAAVSSTPVVVDLDDLEDEKIRHRLAATKFDLRDVKGAVTRVIDITDARRWSALHQDIFSHAAAVTVCSQLDTDKLNRRLGQQSVYAVPNGYADPDRRQTDADSAGSEPILLFVGDLEYRPNAEAARFLCELVLPIVRNSIPSARVRLVGGTGKQSHLGELPGVELVGPVDSIEAELLRASVSCAPLLSGGGTRIKIIEAFAYCVPVVATTVGAEGLDVVHGEQLMIGDSPESFAAHCCAVIRDRDCRDRLRSQGRITFDRSYTAAVVALSVQTVLEALVGPSQPPVVQSVVSPNRVETLK